MTDLKNNLKTAIEFKRIHALLLKNSKNQYFHDALTSVIKFELDLQIRL